MMIMNQDPKVSVLMPVYNSEKYLAQAVESILTQTFTDFRLIAINDGSTDASEEILYSFKQKDERIQIISRGNVGLIDTLNEGLTYATGKYIARMDSDDIALPELFAKQIDFLDTHPDYVAVGERVLMIDEDNAPIRVANSNINHEDIDRAHLQGLGTFPHSGSMIRRDAIQKIGGYRKEMEHAEDIDLWLRLAEVGKLQNLPDVLFWYRLHLKSIGHSKRARQIESTKKLILDAYHRRGLTPPINPYSESETEQSTVNIYQKWAWWALEGGHVSTARKYSFRSVFRQPFSFESWKILYCSLRGR